MAFCFCKSLFFRWLHLLVLSFPLIAGCEPQDNTVQILRQENPFRFADDAVPDQLLLVACNYLALEIPLHINIKDLSLWEDYGLTLLDEENQTLQINSGLDRQVLNAWQKNGLLVAQAPANQWSRFVNELLPDERSRPSRDRVVVFRNQMQVADLPAYWLGRRRSVFMNTSDGIRGFTLENGQTFFRLSCSPHRKNEKTVLVRIIPGFRSDRQDVIIDYENQDIVRETPEILFEKLGFSGTLNSGTLYMLACDTEKSTTNDLGKIFFTSTDGDRQTQMLFLLIPRILTAEEIGRY